MVGDARQLVHARVTSAIVVGALVLIGVLLIALSQPGQIVRDLGIAVLSGGIVGGSLVLVESILSTAADERGAKQSLLRLLSSTEDLNGIDLEHQALRDQYLPGKAMVAARLDGADLTNSRLFFGDFRHASFVGARLDGADLSGAALAGADFTGATLRGTNLVDVDLSHATLVDADLSGALIEDAKMIGADLRGAVLRESVIRTSELMGADLSTTKGLGSAMLERNQHDGETRWPSGFEVEPSEIVPQESIGMMDLATYLAYRVERSRMPEADR